MVCTNERHLFWSFSEFDKCLLLVLMKDDRNLNIWLKIFWEFFSGKKLTIIYVDGDFEKYLPMYKIEKSTSVAKKLVCIGFRVKTCAGRFLGILFPSKSESFTFGFKLTFWQKLLKSALSKAFLENWKHLFYF